MMDRRRPQAWFFADAAGHVHPPQAKRLAPDFYFQPQIYRSDGEIVFAASRQAHGRIHPRPGVSALAARGDDWREGRRQNSTFQLERWVDPTQSGFYSGDHHIHGAGCAHYTSPTEGVTPEDMFKQVEGEGLNVGCVLTWGPCFTYQRKFFAPGASGLSQAAHSNEIRSRNQRLRLGSAGHVCLLNLREQTYPGSEGLKTKAGLRGLCR